MPEWFEYLVILTVVVIAALYVVRRLRASIKGTDTLDCPFADGCDGRNCRKPELRDKCEVSSGNSTCGCDSS